MLLNLGSYIKLTYLHKFLIKTQLQVHFSMTLTINVIYNNCLSIIVSLYQNEIQIKIYVSNLTFTDVLKCISMFKSEKKCNFIHYDISYYSCHYTYTFL